jgi:origin recognition complex subunit 4
VVRTPTKRKAGIANIDIDADPFGDDAEHAKPSPTTAAVSRETFLANEALKRQREARNFKYKGDANAPRQTRSGRVVKEANAEEEDEFGQMDVDEEHEEDQEVQEPMEEGAELEVPPIKSLDAPVFTRTEEAPTLTPTPTISPLSAIAREHVVSILSTITSQSVSTSPGPFRDEDQNEALQGLLKLLQGTVERGEGNSALVTGPRGVGKTRVCLFLSM